MTYALSGLKLEQDTSTQVSVPDTSMKWSLISQPR